MGIKHSFTSFKADGTDLTQVRPSNWNADHAIDGDVDLSGFSLLDGKLNLSIANANLTFDAKSVFFGAGQSELTVTVADPGNHPTTQHFGLFVESTPLGSGANNEPFSDSGIGINIIKQNWDQPSVVGGEIGGLDILVRQGGPTPGAVQSDCSGMLLNVANFGTPGSVSIMEGNSFNMDLASVVTQKIVMQMGVMVATGATVMNNGTQGIGLFLEASVGAIAHFISEDAGTWRYAFYVNKQAGHSYHIDMDGSMQWGNGDISLDYNPGFLRFGNTGIVVGVPTGGNKGDGTINCSGLYVNGVAVTVP
jgi:hypothetical protein